MSGEISEIARSRLFTPGPANTAPAVRAAMQRDWGSRTPEFARLTQHVREGLLRVANAKSEFEAVLLPGSGTYAVEAMVTTLVEPHGRVLIVSNGAYAERMATICAIHGIAHTVCRSGAREPLDWHGAARHLAQGGYTHLALVQCETSTGFLNSVDAAVEVASEYGVDVLVDAMSAFGAFPIDCRDPRLQAIAASANKCLHGVPGVAFVIARRAALERDAAPRTLSLDICAQWREFARSGEWRFTPPTQAVAALAEAIGRYEQAGGADARRRLYHRRCQRIVEGMTRLGFVPVLPADRRAPVIVAFEWPRGTDPDYARFYEACARERVVVYPLTVPGLSGLRIGCIGELEDGDIEDLLRSAARALESATAPLAGGN